MNSILFFQIWALALNVWRESVRDKLVQILAASGILLMLVSLVFGNMAIGGQNRILQDMNFWVLGIWGLVAVLYMGSNIVKNELQRKTIYLILARPVNRSAFLTGKFFGMALVLTTTFCLLALAGLTLMQLKGIVITSKHLWALVFIWGEWILLAAISLFFASFTSPMLHNFFLVGISFLGHWSNDLRIFSENTKDLLIKGLLNAIYHILPNLEALNFREAALYNDVIAPSVLTQGALVLLGWTLSALIAANTVFIRRRLL